MTKASDLAALGGIIATPVGTAPGYVCRAWVNFNGTTNVGGFCTVRASGNVTTVADNGTGDYTVNFTTAMPDANFCGVGFASDSTTKASITDNSSLVRPKTTSTYSVITSVSNGASGLIDAATVQVAIFR